MGGIVSGTPNFGYKIWPDSLWKRVVVANLTVENISEDTVIFNSMSCYNEAYFSVRDTSSFHLGIELCWMDIPFSIHLPPGLKFDTPILIEIKTDSAYTKKLQIGMRFDDPFAYIPPEIVTDHLGCSEEVKRHSMPWEFMPIIWSEPYDLSRLRRIPYSSK